jgi:hypothetical protein
VPGRDTRPDRYYYPCPWGASPGGLSSACACDSTHVRMVASGQRKVVCQHGPSLIRSPPVPPRLGLPFRSCCVCWQSVSVWCSRSIQAPLPAPRCWPRRCKCRPAAHAARLVCADRPCYHLDPGLACVHIWPWLDLSRPPRHSPGLLMHTSQSRTPLLPVIAPVAHTHPTWRLHPHLGMKQAHQWAA